MTATNEDTTPPRLGYRPTLDGIRALAVLAVIGSHSQLWNHPGGGLGVDVFFALSGFLITSLLVEEWSSTSRISLRNFYVRRFLRLLPPMAVFVAVTGATFWFAGTPAERHAVAAALPWILTYLGNWGEVHNVAFGPFGHLWSLAVEEQFYVVWAPVALLALRSRWGMRCLLWAAGLGIILGNLTRVVLLTTGMQASRTFGTDVRSDGILLGCAAAVLWHQGRLHFSARTMRLAGLLAFGVLVDLARHGILPGVPPAWRYSTEVVLVTTAIASTVFIVSVVCQPASGLARLLASPILVWIGKRSYAMYLWHYPFTWYLTINGAPPVERFVVGLAASVILAHASMVFLEGPLATVRRRFGVDAMRRSDIVRQSPGPPEDQLQITSFRGSAP